MAGKVLAAHKNNDESPSPNPAAPRPMLNKEVKLDELSKYFHLPEKAVAKELGICLTSLKKLCRSYGITRWPFRKLKSLERTMRKVQTDADGIGPNGTNGEGENGKTSAGEVKRKPYTVGNKTVFLSDEELEVFKMTMGKDAYQELKPTPIATLEPSLFNNTTMAAASSALASVARGSAIAGSDHDSDSTAISAEVKGRSLSIVNWSTLWSQPQLKGKLLEPLNGVSLRVSPDGVVADLEFRTEETAQRALRICRMAETQALQSAGAGSSLLYQGQSILQGHSTTATAVPCDGAHASPPVSGVHALLSDGCMGGLQPPSTHAQHTFWTSFLSEGDRKNGVLSNKDGMNGHGHGHGDGEKKGPGTSKGIGALGDSLPSPPMTSTAIGLLLESGEKVSAPLSMGAPMGSFFSNLFHACADGEAQTNGNGKATPPSSSNSLSAFLQDGKEEKEAAGEVAESKDAVKKEGGK